MAKWTRTFFRINRKPDGTSDMVSGQGFKGLAMVRIEKGVWVLFHIRTGRSLTRLTGDYQDVKQCCEAICNLVDWPAFASTEEIEAVPDIGARFKALMRNFTEDAPGIAGHA